MRRLQALLASRSKLTEWSEWRDFLFIGEWEQFNKSPILKGEDSVSSDLDLQSVLENLGFTGDFLSIRCPCV